MPWICSGEAIKMGVSIAMRKLPSQLDAVVMDTETALTLRGKSSLVTTHATGLHTQQVSQHHDCNTYPLTHPQP